MEKCTNETLSLTDMVGMRRQIEKKPEMTLLYKRAAEWVREAEKDMASLDKIGGDLFV